MAEMYKHALGSVKVVSAVCPKCGGTDWYGTGSWFVKIMCRKCDIAMKTKLKNNRVNARVYWITFGILGALAAPFLIWWVFVALIFA